MILGLILYVSFALFSDFMVLVISSSVICFSLNSGIFLFSFFSFFFLFFFFLFFLSWYWVCRFLSYCYVVIIQSVCYCLRVFVCFSFIFYCCRWCSAFILWWDESLKYFRLFFWFCFRFFKYCIEFLFLFLSPSFLSLVFRIFDFLSGSLFWPSYTSLFSLSYYFLSFSLSSLAIFFNPNLYER
mgnify:CR=1 FL=1